MILYKKAESDFSNLGLGILRDVIDPVVTESRNSDFYLEFSYPYDGILADEIVLDGVIKCDASHKLKNQLFFITKIDKSSKGRINVHADHVSRKAMTNQLRQSISGRGTAEQALNVWIENLYDQSAPWTAYSDKDFLANYSWELSKTENAMRVLGGQQGSILQVYRGEYEFDNYNIRLWTNRGKRAETIVAYGRNVRDIEQEELIADTITSIFPYVILRGEDGEETEITLPEMVVHSEYATHYSSPKILKLDMSEDESITNADILREKAQKYITDNDIGKPSVSLVVSHTDLSTLMGYEDVPQEVIGLCDVVRVYFERLKIDVEAKVVKTEYNPKLKRYESLTLGKPSGTLSSMISETVRPEIETIRDEAIRGGKVSADGKSSIYHGELEPTSPQERDIWFKQEGTETVLYRYLDGVWQRVLGTEDEVSGDRIIAGIIDASKVTLINLDAYSITSGELDADIIKTGRVSDKTGQNYWDMESGEIRIGDGGIFYNPETGLEIIVSGEELSEHISSKIGVTENNFSINFTKQSELINKNADEANERLTEIESYFRVTPEGLELGNSENPILLKIKPDRIAFEEGGQEVAYISDSSLYITHANITDSMQWGKFRWVHRDNGNFSLV